ncbi:hypothetical protein HK097_000231, partial [Rhizophlyctis rosea]
MPQPSPPPGSLPPTRQARAKCWAARDAYFQCLDSHSLWLQGLKPSSYSEVVSIDPTKPNIIAENDKTVGKEQRRELYACRKEKDGFDRDCLASWVSHFSMLRVKDLQTNFVKKKVEDGEKERQVSDTAFWDKVSAKPNTSA